MNICLVAHSFPPVIGGGETHVYLLAHAFHQRGHNVTVVTGEIPWKVDSIIPHEPFTVLRLNHLRRFEDGQSSFRQVLPELRDALSAKPFDVVHVHNLVPALAIAPLKGIHHGKVIITSHNTPIPEAGRVIGQFADYALDRSFAEFVLRHPFYERIICPSRYYRDWAVQLGVPRRKTVVVHHGIDAERFRVSRDEYWRSLHGYDPTDILFLCPARMISRKGIVDLIDAMHLLNEPRAKLYIASSVRTGSADYAQQVMDVIRIRGLSAKIRVVFDHHTVADMPQLMANCDGLVLPSHREGFGIVLLEGMAAGIPVLGTKTSGISEVIRDGKNGLLAEARNPDDLASKLRRLIEEPKLVNKIVKGGKGSVQKDFTLQKQVDHHLRLYKEACGGT